MSTKPEVGTDMDNRQRDNCVVIISALQLPVRLSVNRGVTEVPFIPRER